MFFVNKNFVGGPSPVLLISWGAPTVVSMPRRHWVWLVGQWRRGLLKTDDRAATFWGPESTILYKNKYPHSILNVFRNKEFFFEWGGVDFDATAGQTKILDSDEQSVIGFTILCVFLY